MPRMFERTLPVRLTQEELIERGWLLGEQRREQRSIEAEKKSANDDFKIRLETCGEESDRLARIVRDKAEPRPVQCYEKRDYKRGVVEVWRTDTGELVDSRVMSEHERQKAITDIDEAEEPEEKPEDGSEGEVVSA